MASTRQAATPARATARGMLGLALAGYLLASWAWTLLGPLAPLLRDRLGLDAMTQAFVVAVPVVVGALARVPAGALTDRIGGRRVQLLVVAATVLALVELAVAGHRSVPGLIAGAVLLGAAGAMFAASVPFAGGWFPAGRRGLALGVLGLGLCGGALGGASAVRLATAYGPAAPFLATAVVVGAYGIAALFTLRDPHPSMNDQNRSPVAVRAVLRLPLTRWSTAWYTVCFAAFVTFTSYLPVYLGNAYALTPGRAGDVMAAFIVVAVLMRPAGGWLADRLSPARPLVAALAVLAATVAVQALGPPLPVVLAVTLPLLAVSLEVAGTAVLTQIAKAAPPGSAGLITGVASASGGLAGFLSPLLMAYAWQNLGGYRPALTVLAVTAAAAAAHAMIRIGRSTKEFGDGAGAA